MQHAEETRATQSHLSRREMLTGLAALSALCGCNCTHNGYGPPYPETDAGRANRAFFVLWLLLTTSPSYFQILPVDATNHNVVTLKLDETNLLTDLKFLLDGNENDQKAAIDAMRKTIGTDTFPDAYGKLNGQLVGPITITYGTALLAVQDLFRQLALSQGKGTSVKPMGGSGGGNGFYSGGSGNCPADVKEILSIATDKPVTSNP